jgi:DNA repair ATPase RecN
VLDQRLEVLTGHAGDVEEAVGDTSQELLRLTEEQLQVLAPSTREALERATAAQAALADEEDQLARDQAALKQASDRIEQLRSTRDDRVAGLNIYARAERDLVEALAALDEDPAAADRPALDRARAVVDGVEERLRQVDGLLGPVLERHRRALEQDRKLLRWADGPASN